METVKLLTQNGVSRDVLIPAVQPKPEVIRYFGGFYKWCPDQFVYKHTTDIYIGPTIEAALPAPRLHN
jgi:hypothetical protein